MGPLGYLRELGQIIADFLRKLGVLRSALVIGALAVMLCAPGAEARTVYAGWGFIRTVVAPTLAPLFLTGLMFDALMCRVFMHEPQAGGPARLRLAMRTELLVGLALVLSYAPFFAGMAGY